MMGGRDSTSDGGLLLVVGETLAGKVCGTALGALDDDGEASSWRATRAILWEEEEGGEEEEDK